MRRCKPAVLICCEMCHQTVRRPYFQARKSVRHYCSNACYYQSRRKPEYRQHRQGQRHARNVVAKYFKIPAGAVIDHVDGNNDNNALANLTVYKSQSDNLKHHHGVAVTPLWEGRNYG